LRLIEIKQKGFRRSIKGLFKKKKYPLLSGKSLRFFISEINIPHPYSVKWKVWTEELEAIKRSVLRGQITSDFGNEQIVRNN
jgi:hypothetical protein